MNVSFFLSKEIGKVPISKDNIFVFFTKDIKLKDIHKLNNKFWLLNGSFNFSEEGISLKRNMVNLKKYQTKTFEFMFFDLDNVKTKFNFERIIEILKKEKLVFNIWESSSHNGLDNFNLKGCWIVKGNNNNYSRKQAMNFLKDLVKDYCTVDMSAYSPASVQKPTHKENLICLNYGEFIPEFYYDESPVLIEIQDNNLLQMSLDEYFNLGYNVKNENDDIITLQHPREKTKGGYFIFKNTPYICHHFNKTKTFSIIDKIKNTNEYKKHLQKRLELEFKNKLYKNSIDITNKINFNKRYIDDEVISNLPEDVNDTAIIVKSPMGTGKTKFIDKYKDKKCLIITNRITLAKEYKEKFPNFKLYNEDLYYAGDSLICQFESLYKYDLKQFDVFIIDEFISLIEHSLSGLTDNANYNNLKLFYILNKFKKPILIMDAFLTGIETMFFKRKNIIYFNNTYRDNVDLFSFDDVNIFINEIKKKLELKDGKITLSTTNKIFARAVFQIFKDDYKVAIITGDTSDKNKYTQHFHKEEHNEWDLFIYTPTITVGINILNQSKHHFHYSDGTGSVINSLQQLKRNRRAENIYVMLNSKKYNKIIDIEVLEIDIKNKLNKYLAKNSTYVDFDKYANLKLSEFGKFTIKKIYLNNLLNMNSKLAFEYLSKEQFKKEFIKINYEVQDYNINDIIKDIKQKDLELYQKEIEELKELNDFEFNMQLENNYDETINKLNKIYKDLTREDIQEILTELSKNKNFLKKASNLQLFLSNEEYIKNLISFALSNNLNRDLIHTFELILQFKKKVTLKQKFPYKEVKDKRFRKFLNLIGYYRKDGNYNLHHLIIKYFNKMKRL